MHGTVTKRRRVERARINPGMLQHTWTEDDIDLLQAYYAAESRQSFWAFRQFVDPTLIKGWWAYYLSVELQKFYEAMKRGERPLWVLEAPPQHGKSRAMTDFAAWLAGKEPDWRTIYASFSSDLGDKANSAMQRMMDSDNYKLTFPKTRLRPLTGRGDEMQYARNSSLLEYIFRKGSFVNTTVDGQVNGKGFDFGIGDDLMKGRNEANSKRIRDRTWDWLMDDFKARMSNEAGMLLMMTRWHIDDVIARFTKAFPHVRVLKFSAIATDKSPDVKLGFRKVGDPLFPEFKSKEFLMEQKKGMSQAGWESVYQQNPIVVGGGMFPITNFKIVPQMFPASEVLATVRFWDKAATEDGGAYTSGVLMHQLRDGRFVVSHVYRKQVGRHEREKAMKLHATMDEAKWPGLHTWIEQEPGSGGKDSAEMTVTNLAGHAVFYERATGDKIIRADPYSGQVQASNVVLVEGEWNQDFIDEHEAFPNSKYKDQVDAAGGAFKKLASTSGYDETLSWVG
jgi:predicted phage terminase large subunit-like protein